MVTEPPEALGLTDSYKHQHSAKKAAAQTEIADQAPPIWLQQMMELMMVGNIAAAQPTGAFSHSPLLSHLLLSHCHYFLL